VYALKRTTDKCRTLGLRFRIDLTLSWSVARALMTHNTGDCARRCAISVLHCKQRNYQTYR